MQEFNEGDLVEAVRGETVIRGRLVTDERVCPTISGSDWGVIALESEGFTLTVIEKAASKLPTEPGAYHDRDGDLWVLVSDGSWVDYSGAYGADWDAPPSRYAPLARLEPVPVTAKKVLDAIRGRIGSIDSAYDFQAVAAEFGVTNA